MDHLLLKWGTLKGWSLENSPETLKALEEYAALGYSMSCAMQQDTPEQKALIIKMIDTVNGEIENDWSGEILTKEQAKKYILEYNRK